MLITPTRMGYDAIVTGMQKWPSAQLSHTALPHLLHTHCAAFSPIASSCGMTEDLHRSCLGTAVFPVWIAAGQRAASKTRSVWTCILQRQPRVLMAEGCRITLN